MAIQDYLRQFPYSLQVPGSPTNRDVADFFLFDLQKGYCDYFATTMAVMVRAVGIPSRLVTGFSSGSYDYTSDRFVVVQSNAHSWVEVFFPGIGWVEFEPTTNQLPFTRPGETGDQSRPASGIPPLPPLAESGLLRLIGVNCVILWWSLNSYWSDWSFYSWPGRSCQSKAGCCVYAPPIRPSPPSICVFTARGMSWACCPMHPARPMNSLALLQPNWKGMLEIITWHLLPPPCRQT